MKERHRLPLINLLQQFDELRNKWEAAAIKAYGIHPKQLFGPREDKFAQFIDPDDFILDLGCGNAKTLRALAEQCRGGIGIEMHARSYHLATTKFASDKVTIIRGDISANLPKLTGQYTVAVMSHILEHIVESVAFLQRLECDKLILLVPTNTWEYKMRGDIGMRPTRWPDHYREYDKDLLVSELQASGWEHKYMEYTEEEELLCYAEKVK